MRCIKLFNLSCSYSISFHIHNHSLCSARPPILQLVPFVFACLRCADLSTSQTHILVRVEQYVRFLLLLFFCTQPRSFSLTWTFSLKKKKERNASKALREKWDSEYSLSSPDHPFSHLYRFCVCMCCSCCCCFFCFFFHSLSQNERTKWKT